MGWFDKLQEIEPFDDLPFDRGRVDALEVAACKRPLGPMRFYTPTPHEESLAERAFHEEIGPDAYVEMLDTAAADDNLVSACFTGAGGTVRADIRLEGLRHDRIREVLITGDFFVTPPRLVFDLEAALRGLDIADAGAAVESFFARTPADLLSLGPGDFRQAIDMALSQRDATTAAS